MEWQQQLEKDGSLDLHKKDDSGYFERSKFVTSLTPNDFDPMNATRLLKHKCSVVLFYAPWCPHCKALASTPHSKGVWESLGEINAYYDVCALNCEKYKDHCEKIRVEDPSLIEGYPTIVFYKRGEPIKKHDGPREVQALTRECLRACASN